MILHVLQSNVRDTPARHRSIYAILNQTLRSLTAAERSESALGNHQKAKRLFAESYDDMRFLGAPEGMATALNHFAYITLQQSDLDEARSIFEQSVRTYREIGDSGGLAETLVGLAQIDIYQKNYAHADQLLSEALVSVGASLGNVTLSILTCSSLLLLETKQTEPAQQIMALVLNHPAANERIREETQQQMQTYAIDVKTQLPFSTEEIIGMVRRYLNSQEWRDHSAEVLAEPPTVRELNVLRLHVDGLRNREIAAELIVSLNTVKTHLKPIYQKLGVENRIQAIQRTQDLNIL